MSLSTSSTPLPKLKTELDTPAPEAGLTIAPPLAPAPSLPAASDAPAAPAPGLSFPALLREIIETVILTVLIYLAVNFATGRFRVEGSSMLPTIHENQYVLVDKISYRLGQPQRGDIVVFNYPLATERDFIKRIIGLPGETVNIVGSVVSVNGLALQEPYIAAPPTSVGTWTLGPDEYFVMGDNRNNSSDSRTWGPLARHYLIGKAILTYWPVESWGLVRHYSYSKTP